MDCCSFDSATGEYALYVVATAKQPFQGSFRININLYNRVLGPAQSPSFFSDAMNDLTLQRPQTMMRLSGTDPSLIQWKAGQPVFTNSIRGIGNPEGVAFFRRPTVGDLAGAPIDK